MIWVNVGVAFLVVVFSMWITVVPAGDSGHPGGFRRQVVASNDIIVRDGEKGLVDATGSFVPLRRYQRIVSGSSVSDEMLLALCEPTRIVRFTHYSAGDSPYRYRFAGKGMDAPVKNVEEVLALTPDLVLVHNIGSAEHVTRMREAGLTVFDFGEMRGLATLLPNLRSLGWLLGRPERGAELAERLERRMRRVAASVAVHARPSGLYLAVQGDKLYGGTKGTSYHDVLTSAGLRDAAAERFTDWPAYTSEQLLSLDPEIIVTSEGTERLVCSHPGLDRLRACRPGGRVVAIDGVLLTSPGLSMLEASEAVFERVHLERESAR